MDATRRDVLLASAALAAAAAIPAAKADDIGPPPLRLATFVPPTGGGPRVGAVVAGGVVDLTTLAAAWPFDPASMLALIAAGAPALAAVRTALATAQPTHPLASVRLLAPIPTPARNVYAVGWNYLEHFAEGQAVRKTDQKYPEHPVFFTKGSHTVNGPYDPIPFDPAVSTMIDWEGELAVIIGKKGRNIAEADAMDHVFGFAVINDTTARDVQNARHGGQWFKGESLDGHGPLGPWIVVRSAAGPDGRSVPDHDNLHLVTRVNGVVKQDANTAQMFFKVPRIISELSLGLTLEAGDIIATGTPPGVGYARKPQEFLKPGDVMETEIAGIGLIRNEIKAVA